MISFLCLSTSAVHSVSVSAYTEQRRVHLLYFVNNAEVYSDWLMRFISYVALQQIIYLYHLLNCPTPLEP